MPTATAVGMATTAESLRGRTRADVSAALGVATVIRFESGYEVWVYRFVEPASRAPSRATSTQAAIERNRAASELVVLFTPSGIVSKVRVRSVAA